MPLKISKLAIGEESGTTIVSGEEDPSTTDVVGEEDGGPDQQYPTDNPFGSY